MTKGDARSGRANPVDVHVGSRLRLRRSMLGMSQEKLGEAIGLTFQQVQKYERGANRIGASRLLDLARVLDVPVSFFFDDMPEEVERASPRRLRAADGDAPPPYTVADPLAKRETLELIRAYYRISDPKVRRRVLDLTKSLARTDDE